VSPLGIWIYLISVGLSSTGGGSTTYSTIGSMISSTIIG